MRNYHKNKHYKRYGISLHMGFWCWHISQHWLQTKYSIVLEHTRGTSSFSYQRDEYKTSQESTSNGSGCGILHPQFKSVTLKSFVSFFTYTYMYMYLQNCVITEMHWWPINLAALIVLQRLLTKFTTTISLLKLQAEIFH